MALREHALSFCCTIAVVLFVALFPLMAQAAAENPAGDSGAEANQLCPAPVQNSKEYAGLGKPKTFEDIRNGKKVTIVNLSQTDCPDTTCQEQGIGGPIPGKCVSKGLCRASKDCQGNALKQPDVKPGETNVGGGTAGPGSAGQTSGGGTETPGQAGQVTGQSILDGAFNPEQQTPGPATSLTNPFANTNLSGYMTPSSISDIGDGSSALDGANLNNSQVIGGQSWQLDSSLQGTTVDYGVDVGQISPQGQSTFGAELDGFSDSPSFWDQIRSSATDFLGDMQERIADAWDTVQRSLGLSDFNPIQPAFGQDAAITALENEVAQLGKTPTGIGNSTFEDFADAVARTESRLPTSEELQDFAQRNGMSPERAEQLQDYLDKRQELDDMRPPSAQPPTNTGGTSGGTPSSGGGQPEGGNPGEGGGGTPGKIELPGMTVEAPEPGTGGGTGEPAATTKTTDLMSELNKGAPVGDQEFAESPEGEKVAERQVDNYRRMDDYLRSRGVDTKGLELFGNSLFKLGNEFFTPSPPLSNGFYSPNVPQVGPGQPFTPSGSPSIAQPGPAATPGIGSASPGPIPTSAVSPGGAAQPGGSAPGAQPGQSAQQPVAQTPGTTPGQSGQEAVNTADILKTLSEQQGNVQIPEGESVDTNLTKSLAGVEGPIDPFLKGAGASLLEAIYGVQPGVDDPADFERTLQKAFCFVCTGEFSGESVQITPESPHGQVISDANPDLPIAGEQYAALSPENQPTNPESLSTSPVSEENKSAPTEPLKAGPNGKIDPVEFQKRAEEKIADSKLNGLAPEALKKYGIEEGTPKEWARLFNMMQQQESGHRIAPVNPDGSLQRFSSTLPTENSFGPGQFNKGEYGLNTWQDVNNPDKVIDAYIKVAEQNKLFAYFGPLQRGELAQTNWYNNNVAPYLDSGTSYQISQFAPVIGTNEDTLSGGRLPGGAVADAGNFAGAPEPASPWRSFNQTAFSQPSAWQPGPAFNFAPSLDAGSDFGGNEALAFGGSQYSPPPLYPNFWEYTPQGPTPVASGPTDFPVSESTALLQEPSPTQQVADAGPQSEPQGPAPESKAGAEARLAEAEKAAEIAKAKADEALKLANEEKKNVDEARRLASKVEKLRGSINNALAKYNEAKAYAAQSNPLGYASAKSALNNFNQAIADAKSILNDPSMPEDLRDANLGRISTLEGYYSRLNQAYQAGDQAGLGLVNPASNAARAVAGIGDTAVREIASDYAVAARAANNARWDGMLADEAVRIAARDVAGVPAPTAPIVAGPTFVGAPNYADWNDYYAPASHIEFPGAPIIETAAFVDPVAYDESLAFDNGSDGSSADVVVAQNAQFPGEGAEQVTVASYEQDGGQAFGAYNYPEEQPYTPFVAVAELTKNPNALALDAWSRGVSSEIANTVTDLVSDPTNAKGNGMVYVNDPFGLIVPREDSEPALGVDGKRVVGIDTSSDGLNTVLQGLPERVSALGEQFVQRGVSLDEVGVLTARVTLDNGPFSAGSNSEAITGPRMTWEQIDDRGVSVLHLTGTAGESDMASYTKNYALRVDPDAPVVEGERAPRLPGKSVTAWAEEITNHYDEQVNRAFNLVPPTIPAEPMMPSTQEEVAESAREPVRKDSTITNPPGPAATPPPSRTGGATPPPRGASAPPGGSAAPSNSAPSNSTGGGFNLGNFGQIFSSIGQLFGSLFGQNQNQNNQQKPATAPASNTPKTDTPAATPSIPAAMVSIVANPSSVAPGAKPRLSWASVNTKNCVVAGPDGKILDGASDGSTQFSAALTRSSEFGALCAANAGGYVTATTSVRVVGDADPVRIVAFPVLPENPASESQTPAPAQTQTDTPTTSNTQTSQYTEDGNCNPNLPASQFITCLQGVQY